ncbi:MAG: dinitrogenase iron-molybdenum cofactor biosynthesis protein [Thermodesulfobacteria bacterium]|nr:dinitrogenase iron-molybdenum cofactor biosynthesis protein [Thermodesulfobacteriota bacterium]
MKKIAISAEGKDLTARVDPHFGRAAYFIIYDLETDSWEVFENPAATEARGAGIAAATFLAEKGVDVIVTGHCGPKAFSVLKAAGIKVANVSGKTVAEVVTLAREGKLEFLEAPNADTHFGGGIPGLGKIMGGGTGRGCGGSGGGKGCGGKGRKCQKRGGGRS